MGMVSFTSGKKTLLEDMIVEQLEDVSLVECMHLVFITMRVGVIVGDSGLCCCVPVQCMTSIIVRAQLLPIVCGFVLTTCSLYIALPKL